MKKPARQALMSWITPPPSCCWKNGPTCGRAESLCREQRFVRFEPGHRSAVAFYFALFLLFWFGYELATQPAHGDQVLRLGRVGFNVTPEPDHKIINRARISILVQVPDLLQN